MPLDRSSKYLLHGIYIPCNRYRWGMGIEIKFKIGLIKR